jgi:hypothetical protein
MVVDIFLAFFCRFHDTHTVVRSESTKTQNTIHATHTTCIQSPNIASPSPCLGRNELAVPRGGENMGLKRMAVGPTTAVTRETLHKVSLPFFNNIHSDVAASVYLSFVVCH